MAANESPAPGTAIVTLHVPIVLRTALFRAAREAGVPVSELIKIRAGIVPGFCRVCARKKSSTDWPEVSLCTVCEHFLAKHGHWTALALALDNPPLALDTPPRNTTPEAPR